MISTRVTAAALCACCTLLWSACATAYYPQYAIRLTEVEKPESSRERFGSVQRNASADSIRFEDQLVRVAARAVASGVAFEIRNKSGHPVKILWGDAALVAPDGRSSPVLHRGLARVDCARAKSPTIIPAGSFVSDFAIACDESILPECAVRTADTTVVRALVGQSVRLLLPLEVEAVVNNYTWKFEVSDVQLMPAIGLIQEDACR